MPTWRSFGNRSNFTRDRNGGFGASRHGSFQGKNKQINDNHSLIYLRLRLWSVLTLQSSVVNEVCEKVKCVDIQCGSETVKTGNSLEHDKAENLGMFQNDSDTVETFDLV